MLIYDDDRGAIMESSLGEWPTAAICAIMELADGMADSVGEKIPLRDIL